MATIDKCFNINTYTKSMEGITVSYQNSSNYVRIVNSDLIQPYFREINAILTFCIFKTGNDYYYAILGATSYSNISPMIMYTRNSDKTYTFNTTSKIAIASTIAGTDATIYLYPANNTTITFTGGFASATVFGRHP